MSTSTSPENSFPLRYEPQVMHWTPGIRDVAASFTIASISSTSARGIFWSRSSYLERAARQSVSPTLENNKEQMADFTLQDR